MTSSRAHHSGGFGFGAVFRSRARPAWRAFPSFVRFVFVFVVVLFGLRFLCLCFLFFCFVFCFYHTEVSPPHTHTFTSPRLPKQPHTAVFSIPPQGAPPPILGVGSIYIAHDSCVSLSYPEGFCTALSGILACAPEFWAPGPHFEGVSQGTHRGHPCCCSLGLLPHKCEGKETSLGVHTRPARWLRHA